MRIAGLILPVALFAAAVSATPAHAQTSIAQTIAQQLRDWLEAHRNQPPRGAPGPIAAAGLPIAAAAAGVALFRRRRRKG